MGVRSIGVAAGAGLLVLTSPGVALADPPLPDGGPYDDGIVQESFELCGIPVHVVRTRTGVFSERRAPGSDQAFLAMDRYSYTNVFTLDDEDPTTNGSLRIEATGLFREQSARQLDPANPNVYAFRAIDRTTFRAYSSDGQLLYRNTGVLHLDAVLDTLGDGQPSAEIISETVRVSGYTKDVDFCGALVHELT
jgi:hypothetical protein